MNIAIDGPAGAGKSTVAKLVAKATDSIYIDTGAMYRAMALYMLNGKIDGSDKELVETACENADVSIAHISGEQHVLLNGEDVTDRIRSEDVSRMASKISVYGKVREKLVSLQQELAKKASVVMDGRDIGTVVLPDAEVKIYLTASAHTRAMRRFREVEEKEIAAGKKPLTPVEEALEIERIEHDIAERDERDENRTISPLRQASDAVLIDSSDLTVDEVVVKILDIVDSRREGASGPLKYTNIQ